MAQKNTVVIAHVEIDAKQALTEYKKLQKEIDETEKKLKDAKVGTIKYAKLTQTLKALKTQAKEYQDVIQNNVKQEKAEGESVEQLRAKLANLTRQYNKLSEKERTFGIGRQVIKDINQTMIKLTEAEHAVGNFRRNVGNYMSGFQKIGHNWMIGITQAVRSFISPLAVATSLLNKFRNAIIETIETNKEFQQANANLASILGKTRDEITDMTASARLLGETTIFTASEVTKLQTELAKLGFSKEEIMQSQEAVLKFAQATGAELPEAAATAGATLRSFGMDASEMERVVSTLAVSTTKSALTFDKLSTAMPIVASVAKTSNFSLEDTVALLGKLSDSGMDATMAATATRNILLNLANSSGKLAQKLGQPIKGINDLAPALEKLKKDGIGLAEAFDLTDKRSVNAFTIFIERANELTQMRDQITNVGDDLDKMVKTQMDTLSSSSKILKSAWQELMLTFAGGNGVLKKLTDHLTRAIQLIAELARTNTQNSFRQIEKAVKEQSMSQEQIDDLYKKEINELKDDNEVNKKYVKIISDQNKVLSEKANRLAEVNRLLDENPYDQEKGIASYLDKNIFGGVSPRTIGIELDKLKKERENLQNEVIQAQVNIHNAEAILQKTIKEEAVTEKKFDPDAEKKAKEAARQWKKALNEYYRLLKTTEEESIQMTERQYDKAIDTATKIYDELSKNGTNLTEEEELQKEEALNRIFALENEKQRKIDQLQNKYLDKFISKRLNEINNADAEELNSFLTTEIRKTEIAKDQAEQRKILYNDELAELERRSAEAATQLKELLDVPEDQQDLQAISRLQILIDDLYQKILKTKALIAKEQGIIDSSEYQKIAQQMSYELNVAGQTYAEKYRIKQEYLQKELEAVRGNAEKERDIEYQQFENRKEYLNSLHDEISTFSEKSQEILEHAFDIASNREQAELNNYKSTQDKKKNALKERLDAGLICQEEYDNAVEQMDKELAAKELEIQIAEAKREKAQGIISAIINTALAIMKIWADVPKVDFGASTIALTGLVSTIGAMQVASIASQPLPTAGTGMLIEGQDHAHGGVLINAEGGEAIINKKATKKYLPLLSKINQSTGGVPLFGQGGMVGAQVSQAVSESAIDYNKIAQACASMQIQVAVTDINKGQSKMARVVSRKTY